MKHFVSSFSSMTHQKRLTLLVISVIIISLASSSTFALITGPSNTLLVGKKMQLTSSDNDGYWSSYNPSVATVSQTGLVTGISVGATPILYYSSSNGVSIYSIQVTNYIPPPPTYNTFTPKGNDFQENAPVYNGTAADSDDYSLADQYEHYGRQNIVLDGAGSYTCADYAWGMAQNPGFKTSSTYGVKMINDGSYSPGTANNHAIICYDTNHWAIKASEVKRFNPDYLEDYSEFYLQYSNLYISKWNAGGPLVMHHLQDCPFYSSSTSFTYYKADW